ATITLPACSSGGGGEHAVTSRQALLGPKPLHSITASDKASQAFGISEWRFYGGKTKFVVTGYDTHGKSVRGGSILMGKGSAKARPHLTFKMHDGTKAVRRWFTNGKAKGKFNLDQKKLLAYIQKDFSAYATSHPATGGSMIVKSSGGMHITANT